MRALRVALALVAAAALASAAHFALIEVGREVVTVRVPRADGSPLVRRVWIVDDGASSWLHSAGLGWNAAFASAPIVELERGGRTLHLRATPVPGPHPRVHELLRAKYGVADRWVRLVGPDPASALAVRLDPLPATP